MDAETIRSMLEQHFTAGDPARAHEMYQDDAVLHFPQSGERFVGIENLKGWRGNYPASIEVEYAEIRGREDLWVAEILIRYDKGDWNYGVSIIELRDEKFARETIYVGEGWDPPDWRAEWRASP